MAFVSSKPNSSSLDTSRERLAIGQSIVERYRILQVIGEGGMGTVYAAEHLALRKKVAVKVLHMDLLRLPNIVARFEREARATARIEHPNVAGALDFGRLPNGALFLVLEFVDGRRLREQIDEGPLLLPRALNIAKQIASVLATAQSLGIVHRDLKPENVILVQRDNEPDFVKVLDFGIARMTSVEEDGASQPPLTKLGAVFGTPEYMAPEQALGQRVDTRADLYSLGVILFEMIAGVRPYVTTDTSAILSQQITAPRPTFAERAPNIQVPQAVERLISRLLAKGAQERFQRAAEVVTVLDGLLAGEEVKKALSSVPPTQCSTPLPSFELNTQLTGLHTDSEKVTEKSFDAVWLRLRSVFEWLGRRCWRAARGSLKLSDQVTESVLQRLPERLKQRARVVPVGAWRTIVTIGAFVLGIFPIVVLAMLVRLAAHRSEVVSASSVLIVPSTLVVPTSAPEPSVAPVVLDENSKDPDVLLALAISRLEANRESDAVTFVLRALTRQPERRNDERVATVLYKTANSEQPELAERTLSLLQGTMAAKGAEIQYQLWLDRSVREAVRKRIDRWLRSQAFERAASGAIQIAVRLRLAESCEKKSKLLGTAAKIGGPAALAYLSELKSTTGCGYNGKSDCYSCLRQERHLDDAIAQIQARVDAK
jgi:serine/threonine-protein kinase